MTLGEIHLFAQKQVSAPDDSSRRRIADKLGFRELKGPFFKARPDLVDLPNLGRAANFPRIISGQMETGKGDVHYQSFIA